MTAADLTPAFYFVSFWSTGRSLSPRRRRRRVGVVLSSLDAARSRPGGVDAMRGRHAVDATKAPKKVPRRARTVRLLVGHERLEVVDRAVDEDARQVLARDGRHEGVGARREDALVVGDELVAAGHGLLVDV